ncbi:MAG: HAD-IA family hydrolase [Gemmataceae bacterium]
MSLVPSGIRAVFFDAVGTLILPRPPAHEVYAVVAAKQGATLDPRVVRERFVAAYRTEEEADRACGWRTSEERERTRWRTIVTSALAELPDPERGFLDLFEHFARPESWELSPHAAGVLEAFERRGLVLGMGTNYDSRVERVVAGLPELSPVVGRLVISAAVGYRKPATEFFQEVIRVAGCAPCDILFVGDDVENDFFGARNAGLRSVLLDPKQPGEGRITSLLELLV